MSIAVSAVIRPSRLLRLALAGFAMLNLCVALALAWPVPAGGGHFRLPQGIAVTCLLAAGWAGLAGARGEMKRRIDISGVGEIRLTVQQSLGRAGMRRTRMGLLPGSTVWPQCQLLLMRPEKGGAVIVFTVMPDSVAPAQFRAIAVAIKAIAGRDNKFFGKNKKL